MTWIPFTWEKYSSLFINSFYPSDKRTDLLSPLLLSPMLPSTLSSPANIYRNHFISPFTVFFFSPNLSFPLLLLFPLHTSPKLLYLSLPIFLLLSPQSDSGYTKFFEKGVTIDGGGDRGLVLPNHRETSRVVQLPSQLVTEKFSVSLHF